MAVDAQRGTLYTVFGGPNTNYWGGDRHGNDLYGNSVVALDAETGKMKWYFQVVHHDIFDYDLPPAPALLDATVSGKRVPMLAQTGKIGLTLPRPVSGAVSGGVAAVGKMGFVFVKSLDEASCG